MNDPLVSPDWLAGVLDQPEIAVLDATWFMPGGRDGRTEFEAARIPGARYLDIDSVADRSTNLPHMLPSPEAFAKAMSELGVADDSQVVVYDANALMASARVWWMLRTMGHDGVHVLDGGLGAWRAQGLPIETGPAEPPAPARFTARFRPELVVDLDQVSQQTDKVVDARSAARFHGEAPEPRAGLRGGHMPGSRNLPYGELVTAQGRLKTADELKQTYSEAKVDPAVPAITSCGSGVTAAVLALGYARLGAWDTPVYDGSWAEWGAGEDTPIERS